MAKRFTAVTASNVSLVEVRIIEGRIESHEDFAIEHIHSYDPDCSLRIFSGIHGDLLRAELKVWVDTESTPNQPEAHGHFHFNFYFAVVSLADWIMEGPEGEMTLDPGLQNAIASVTYSTARGMLISRFQGTVFQRFILPVINPNDLLQMSARPKKSRAPKV